jgi:hypothetical protein
MPRGNGAGRGRGDENGVGWTRGLATNNRSLFLIPNIPNANTCAETFVFDIIDCQERVDIRRIF